MKVVAGPEADILVGNALPLRNIPLGTTVHHVALRPGKGDTMACSGGAVALLVTKDRVHAHVNLPSGEVRLAKVDSMATIDQVWNHDYANVTVGNAGRTRHLG